MTFSGDNGHQKKANKNIYVISIISTSKCQLVPLLPNLEKSSKTSIIQPPVNQLSLLSKHVRHTVNSDNQGIRIHESIYFVRLLLTSTVALSLGHGYETLG